MKTLPPVKTFEQLADASLLTTRETYAQRGKEYSDTMTSCQWLALKAVLDKLALPVPSNRQCCALAMAVLVDVKYARLGGGWKADSVVDGIAYNAAMLEAVKQALEELQG